MKEELEVRVYFDNRVTTLSFTELEKKRNEFPPDSKCEILYNNTVIDATSKLNDILIIIKDKNEKI